jgi:hypothetical protein
MLLRTRLRARKRLETSRLFQSSCPDLIRASTPFWFFRRETWIAGRKGVYARLNGLCSAVTKTERPSFVIASEAIQFLMVRRSQQRVRARLPTRYGAVSNHEAEMGILGLWPHPSGRAQQRARQDEASFPVIARSVAAKQYSPSLSLPVYGGGLGGEITWIASLRSQ